MFSGSSDWDVTSSLDLVLDATPVSALLDCSFLVDALEILATGAFFRMLDLFGAISSNFL